MVDEQGRCERSDGLWVLLCRLVIVDERGDCERSGWLVGAAVWLVMMSVSVL